MPPRYESSKCLTCNSEKIPHRRFCLGCMAAQKRAWRAENPEQTREILRRSYYKHLAKRRADARASYALNPEPVKTASKARIKRVGRPPYGDKGRARGVLHNAVRRGRVVKPLDCSGCGVSGQRIDGHHGDYSKPLDVVWLCTRCHGLRHRKPVANGEALEALSRCGVRVTP